MSELHLKAIDLDAIPRALHKAERYRLLNEPEEAESICLDVLAIQPHNQEATVALLLALTDQFHHNCGECYNRALAVLPRLTGEYERCYYAGIIQERRAAAILDRHGPGSGEAAYANLRTAMDWYERAEAIRPAENDDALLRWNTCVRMIHKHSLHAPPSEEFDPITLE